MALWLTSLHKLRSFSRCECCEDPLARRHQWARCWLHYCRGVTQGCHVAHWQELTPVPIPAQQHSKVYVGCQYFPNHLSAVRVHDSCRIYATEFMLRHVASFVCAAKMLGPQGSAGPTASVMDTKVDSEAWDFLLQNRCCNMLLARSKLSCLAPPSTAHVVPRRLSSF